VIQDQQAEVELKSGMFPVSQKLPSCNLHLSVKLFHRGFQEVVNTKLDSVGGVKSRISDFL
jgi:hypothetical protein